MPVSLSGAGQGGPTFLPGAPRPRSHLLSGQWGVWFHPAFPLEEGGSPQLPSHHREKGQVAQQPPGDKGLLFWMDTPF